MKQNEKEKAIELRTCGYSLKEIASALNVAKSSVSSWVRHVHLNDAAKQRIQILQENSYRNRNVEFYKKYMDRRKDWRNQGKQLISNRDALDVALLYWAEGYKKNNKNMMAFTNSDPSMLLIFMQKLISGYGVNKDDIKISLNAYTDFHNEAEIIHYWTSLLDISEASVKGITLNSISRYSNQKRCGYLEWGTCRLIVHSTEILQLIYGVIDAYTESNGMKSTCTNENATMM